MKGKSFLSIIFALLILTVLQPSACFAQEHEVEENNTHSEDSHSEEEEFDPGTFILDHIADSHEWHIYTDKHGHHKSVYLPVILISNSKGLSVFSSKHLSHGHVHEGFMIVSEGDLKGRVVEVDEEGHIIEGKLPIDLSITKNITAMLISAIILLWLFIALARSYKKTGVSEPKGIQGFLEPIVLFVRDEIAIPNIGEAKFEKYMPYLLTAFFFILINNLMGLVPVLPGGANVTGNIGVTLVLALFTFLITQFSGNKNYWRHIFNTPGVPTWLKPIMIPVELIGIFSKPFALMVRLFANITAGHIIVLSLVSLIFIFKSLLMAPVSALFVIFMDCLELLVAFLQAYVFTLLSALFIGMAVEEHH